MDDEDVFLDFLFEVARLLEGEWLRLEPLLLDRLTVPDDREALAELFREWEDAELERPDFDDRETDVDFDLDLDLDLDLLPAHTGSVIVINPVRSKMRPSVERRFMVAILSLLLLGSASKVPRGA